MQCHLIWICVDWISSGFPLQFWWYRRRPKKNPHRFNFGIIKIKSKPTHSMKEREFGSLSLNHRSVHLNWTTFNISIMSQLKSLNNQEKPNPAAYKSISQNKPNQLSTEYFLRFFCFRFVSYSWPHVLHDHNALFFNAFTVRVNIICNCLYIEFQQITDSIQFISTDFNRIRIHFSHKHLSWESNEMDRRVSLDSVVQKVGPTTTTTILCRAEQFVWNKIKLLTP